MYYVCIDVGELVVLCGMLFMLDDYVCCVLIGELMCGFELNMCVFGVCYGLDFKCSFVNEL